LKGFGIGKTKSGVQLQTAAEITASLKAELSAAEIENLEADPG
jgi:hypothetical protein